jgi:hypothetical protein
MIISAILDPKTESFYIDLHAEQSFISTFLIFNEIIELNIIDGIYQSLLMDETVENINDYFDELPKSKMIVLDFGKINDVQMNKSDLFAELIDKTELLIFTNVSKEIIEKIGLKIFNSPSSVLVDDIYTKFFLTNESKDEVQILDREVLFNDLLLSNIIECKNDKEKNKKHHSSSVYLPIFIDLKQMIVNNKSFFIYVVYKLSLKMKEKWNLDDNPNKEVKNPVLFCQNLNSSFIASLLSSFLKLDILSMDHIGPINKVYSNLKNRIQEGSDYIVISDFVCLGTEVKICKNVINYSGGNYKGNASIVRVETLKPEDDYTDYEYVFKITKNNNSEIKYKIKTALK